MDLHLPTPTEFPAFPYDPPYDIQISLMRHLYESIEGKKVTIIESPTGTGKTLTLLCSALTWLLDEKERARKGKMKELVGEKGLEAKGWVIEQTIARLRREMEIDEREYEERLAQARKREETLRRASKARVIKRSRVEHTSGSGLAKEEDDEDRFLPETDQNPVNDDKIPVSAALQALMDKFQKSTPTVGLPEEEITCTKIYYASRTHSQLSQVLPELSRLKLTVRTDIGNDRSEQPPIASRKRQLDVEGDNDDEPRPSTRAVSLGSRKQLCINDNLRMKASDLDEACRELLGEKENKRCQYLPPPGEEEKMHDFRDQILASPKDIEDLAAAGRLSNICPYFGSRRAIPQAELVTLPYNLLLQKSARKALGIDLTDQIVLIDEAHNLIPTLLSLSTTRVTYSILSTSLEQVCTYVARFKNKLSPANMLHLKRLIIFLDTLKKYMEGWKESQGKEKEKVEILTAGQLMERLGKRVAGINLLEIEAYLKRSKVARKISGYSEKQAEKNADPTSKHQSKRGKIPPLHAVEEFMLSLTNASADGRITLSLNSIPNNNNSSVEIKYQLLNPAPHFQEVVEDARAVVLAGGTMSPMHDVINQLFRQLPEGKVTTFSCGHIIPEKNLQTLVISRGPNGNELEFKAERQADPATISQLGQILLNFSNIIPAGMIVFFPSYKFLNTAKAQWMKSQMLDKFAVKKKVFFEPEEGSLVDSVLKDYSVAAKQPPEDSKKGGAILFAVVGAKLSEGLNFADDLARGVVIVGLPFANLGSPELRERMKYAKSLEQQALASGKSREKGQKDAAMELYENMCMNAVNQSIGRAIRHRNDWASLLLLDKRYGHASIRNKLPKWIGSRTITTESFGQTIKEMSTFFKGKRQ